MLCLRAHGVTGARLALPTSAEVAKRKNMGEDAILHCRSYALEAERKMGQMLKETERNPGVRTKGGGKGAGGSVALPPADKPTLADLGISKRESAEAHGHPGSTGDVTLPVGFPQAHGHPGWRRSNAR